MPVALGGISLGVGGLGVPAWVWMPTVPTWQLVVGGVALLALLWWWLRWRSKLDPRPSERRPCIFITGAASGIGMAAAEFFANKGWFVGCYDVNEPALALVARKINTFYPNTKIWNATGLPDEAKERANGGVGGVPPTPVAMGRVSCCYRKMDVTRPAEVAAAVAQFSVATGGMMDVMLLCAGLCKESLFEEIKLETHLTTVAINLSGVITCVHAGMPLLKASGAQGRADVITISSSTALYGLPEYSTYAATKGGVRTLTECLNMELERYSIQVVDLYPPVVDTPMVQNQTTPATVHGSSFATIVKPTAVAERIWSVVDSNYRSDVHVVMDVGIWLLSKVVAVCPAMGRAISRFIALPRRAQV
jgi:NAD(P)-dependent dehydrogenase (short-subunit alcohol dehydrogenase family)